MKAVGGAGRHGDKGLRLAGSGAWSVESGERRAESAERRAGSGAWSVERGAWSVESGEWRAERCTAEPPEGSGIEPRYRNVAPSRHPVKCHRQWLVTTFGITAPISFPITLRW